MALTCAFFSCSEDSEDMIMESSENGLMTKAIVNSDYYVKDGCIHVDDMNAYRGLVNSLIGKTEEESFTFCKNTVKGGMEFMLIHIK